MGNPSSDSHKVAELEGRIRAMLGTMRRTREALGALHRRILLETEWMEKLRVAHLRAENAEEERDETLDAARLLMMSVDFLCEQQAMPDDGWLTPEVAAACDYIRALGEKDGEG